MRRFVAAFILMLSLNAHAAESALDLVLQSGSIDNVYLQQDASIDKESSLFGRFTAIGWVGWDVGPKSDKLYVFGVTDTKIISSTERATSIYFDLGPGYKAQLLDGLMEFDCNAHFAGDFAGDDTEQANVERTRSIRTGAPTLLPGSSLTVLPLPSSFFSYSAEASGLMLFSGSKLGPVFRIQRKNYMRVNHGDTRMILTLKSETPIRKAFLIGAELGAVHNASNVEGYDTDGVLGFVSLAWDVGSGYVLNGDFQYETRVFQEASDRTDNIWATHFGLEKSVLRDFVLLFDLHIIDDNSSDELYRYTDNVLALGLKWLVF